MNYIWVHRKARGLNLSKRLMKEMMETEKQVVSFATLALEDYWMIWMRKGEMEKLGFMSIESTRLKHKTYHIEKSFKTHLMWLSVTKNERRPTWDKSKLLVGVSFCPYHPIYLESYGVKNLVLRKFTKNTASLLLHLLRLYLLQDDIPWMKTIFTVKS